MSMTEDGADGFPDRSEKKRRGLGRGLGRGLSALFEDEEPYPQSAGGGESEDGGEGGNAAGLAEGSRSNRRTINISQIEPGPAQPRQVFDEEALAELAASIARHGILQPLLVRPREGVEGVFQIIAGERRWRAAQLAQLHEVPVVIRADLDEEAVMEVALVENLQREDLNPLEEAEGYKNLIDRFGHSQENIADFVGKSRSHVSNMMRLLSLPGPVRALLRDGALSAGHARTLVTAKDPIALAKRIVEGGLSVRQAERLAAEDSGRSKPKSSGPGAQQKAASKDADTLALENEVSSALGMRVSIEVSAEGTSGALRIEFKTLDQLDEILHRLSHYPGSRISG